MLAILAAHAPRSVSRDKLVSLLWSECDTARANHRLKQNVYVVRRALGADAITGLHHLRLGPGVTCDVCEFEDCGHGGDAAGAIACYAGAFMDGFHLGGDAGAFERWVEAKRDQLAQTYSESLERALQVAELRTDPREVLRLRRLQAESAPLDVRYARGLMAALSAVGDSLGALRHAERYRRTVLEQLGPDARLRGLD